MPSCGLGELGAGVAAVGPDRLIAPAGSFGLPDQRWERCAVLDVRWGEVRGDEQFACVECDVALDVVDLLRAVVSRSTGR